MYSNDAEVGHREGNFKSCVSRGNGYGPHSGLLSVLLKLPAHQLSVKEFLTLFSLPGFQTVLKIPFK